MVFLKLVHTEYQVNYKTQPFWVKVVHLVPNNQTLAGHEVGAIRLAPTATLYFNTVLKTKYRTRAIISRSRFEAALVYKPRILSFKKELRNIGRSAA
jgi:hypothetical protein